MKLILLRHGQSEWNLSNRFTGWTDVELSAAGREEAARAGRKIRQAGLRPRYYFTSWLRRAIHTLQIAASAMELDYVPVYKDWHLNERHYGALQGLDKAETARIHGADQVHRWRRSYALRPPMLTEDDDRWPGRQEMYAGVPREALPLGESLQDAVTRVRACWEERIAPALRLYDLVLVAAHGNSLRALAMIVKGISEDDIPALEIPTGAPWVLDLDDSLHAVSDRYL